MASSRIGSPLLPLPYPPLHPCPVQISHLRKAEGELCARLQQSMRERGIPVPPMPEEGPADVAAAAAAAGLPPAVLAAMGYVGPAGGPPQQQPQLPPPQQVMPPGLGQAPPAAPGTITAASAAARAGAAPGASGQFQQWLAGGPAGGLPAPGAGAIPAPVPGALVSSSAAGNGSAVGGVTSSVGGAGAGADGGGGGGKMQSLDGDGGMDQVGVGDASACMVDGCKEGGRKEKGLCGCVWLRAPWRSSWCACHSLVRPSCLHCPGSEPPH